MSGKSQSELKVELIDVGHGDALILHWTPRTGKPHTILIDGGPRLGAERIKATLDRLGAAAIDLAVLSHCDSDHVDGLLAYVNRQDRLPIRRYWGPCLPAFRRHDWLFPDRIKRGLRQVESVEDALKGSCHVSWPVEGASWSSADGDLTIRVVSPAGRLIERLLLADDALSLFLENPMPIGWLLAPPSDLPGMEDPYADLRFAIGTGEITPDRVPDLPPSPRTAPAERVQAQAAAQGVEPEFFGNPVLNDTSIVLLVEVRLDHVQRRLLFTGDLENFAYLMARQPMGFGCEIVKAPHHGSYSFVERDIAYDAVWQWLRPRAVLVSANGKHGLPRSDFRDAVLRYGGTLFCTSRRSREIVSGPGGEPCCRVRFACNSQAPVSLSVTSGGIVAEGVACARGTHSDVLPVIEVRQHVVEPSPILATLAEREIRRHVDWMVQWLRRTLRERQGQPGDPNLRPVGLDTLRQAAVAADRIAAAAEIETIAERAAREGRVWLSRTSRFGDGRRSAWVMPSEPDIESLVACLDGFSVIQLAVKDPAAAAALEELLYAAETTWISDWLAERTSFPTAMFDDVLWPILVRRLLRTRTAAFRRPDKVSSNGTGVILALFKNTSVEGAVRDLADRLRAVSDAECILGYLSKLEAQLNRYDGHLPSWPDELSSIVTPLWQKDRNTRHGEQWVALPPSFLMAGAPLPTISAQDSAVFDHWRAMVRSNWGRATIDSALVPDLFAATILSGLQVVSRPDSRTKGEPRLD